MQTLMKTLVIASTLLAGTVSATGFAMASSDGAYHWGYPDSLKEQRGSRSALWRGERHPGSVSLAGEQASERGSPMAATGVPSGSPVVLREKLP